MQPSSLVPVCDLSIPRVLGFSLVGWLRVEHPLGNGLGVRGLGFRVEGVGFRE